jgi:hypothetical protein
MSTKIISFLMNFFSIFKENNIFLRKSLVTVCTVGVFLGLLTIISCRPPVGVVEGMEKTTGEKDLKEKSAAHDEGYASHDDDDDDDGRKDNYRQPSKKKHKHGNGEKRKYEDDDDREDEEKASPLKFTLQVKHNSCYYFPLSASLN